MKNVAASQSGHVWALRDHVWAQRASQSVWGVYFLNNGAWLDYGGANGAASGVTYVQLCALLELLALLLS